MTSHTPTYRRLAHSEPSNAFHEMRRYLMSLGIETRIGTFASVPLPEEMRGSSATSINADDLLCLDNAFVFELRRLIQTDVGPLNTTILMCRVFFEKHQDAQAFQFQIVANHKGGGTFEINQTYHDVIQCLQCLGGWSAVKGNSRVFTMEKAFDSLRCFKTEFSALHAILKGHDTLNNHQFPNQI